MKILEKVKLPLAALAVMVLSFGGVLAISAGNDTYARVYCKNTAGNNIKIFSGNACPTSGEYTNQATTDDLKDLKLYTCLDGTSAYGSSQEEACGENGGAAGHETDLMSVLNTIVNVVIGVIGFIAVVMIVIGGIQYTISSGDTGKVTKAKNTIMYGIIGLVIALLAFAIVNFILSNVFD